MGNLKLKSLLTKKIYEAEERKGMELKGATLPLQALKGIGVVKPEYLQVVLAKIKKGESLPPLDDKYLADIFLKMLATDKADLMVQLFNAIRATSATNKDQEEQ